MRRRSRPPLSRTRLIAPVGVLIAAGAWAATSTCAPRQSPAPAPPPLIRADSLATDSAAALLLQDVRALDSTIVVQLRYATSDNFTGAPLPGYEGNRAYLRREAAAALARVNRALADSGLALEIWDAYRPVRATEAMVEWARRTGREQLFRDGYIASRSRHNLGLAVDLTLVERVSGRELEMGTPFDTFSEAAHTANAAGVAARNRARLVRAMRSEGFANYAREWWHFSFQAADPVRFDVPIR